MAISDCVTLDALRVGADLKGIAFISSQVVVTCRVSSPDELATIKEIIRIHDRTITSAVAAGGRTAAYESAGPSSSRGSAAAKCATASSPVRPSPCRRGIHVLRSDFGGEGAQSRLSFGAAVESWRVRSLCVQIRLICPHALPGALRSGPGLALAPAVPLDTRHHERHEHDDDQDPACALPVTLG